MQTHYSAKSVSGAVFIALAGKSDLDKKGQFNASGNRNVSLQLGVEGLGSCCSCRKN